MDPDYLLVYGTLCSGFLNEWQQKLDNCSKLLGPVFVPGKLYNIGEYPGAKESNDQSVFECELYQIYQSKKELFLILDEYEGNEYFRKLVEIKFKKENITSWIYWYKGKTEENQLILCRSYTEFINRNF